MSRSSDDATLRLGGTETHAGAERLRSLSPPAEGFVPGTILADRYRIVALIGSGGMGNVYRAEDLKLGQPVALKLISRQLLENERALDSVLSEVRIGRQVSHPNLCRIYDVVEFEGDQFIAMELVDGEDLASLLRRIGRLPEEKAFAIARDLCAGLAAAHDRGVIHRDLKPANVMIDSRGTARITDFGLAILADGPRGENRSAGTPAYMAPEQLGGRNATEKSDVYALGLILFEIFTGRRMFGGDLSEILAAHGTPKPRPSSIVRIDPIMERLILRCIEENPADRPPLRSLMLELPGGDPLRAALAAGDTPSPGVVAATDAGGALMPRHAWAALLSILVLLTAIILFSGTTELYRQVPLPHPPEVLTEKAQAIIRLCGYESNASVSRLWFQSDREWLRQSSRNPDGSPGSIRPTPITFGYREDSEPMLQTQSIPSHAGARAAHIRWSERPLRMAGTKNVLLDSEGRLRRFDALPSDTGAASVQPFHWRRLFDAAGLDMSRFRPAPRRGLVPASFDERETWLGTTAAQNPIEIEVDAASYQGHPVHFSVHPAAIPVSAQPPQRIRLGHQFGLTALGAILALSVVIAGFTARSNWLQGRGDRRGALKIAMFVGLAWLGSELLFYDHSWDIEKEWSVLTLALGGSLFVAAEVWLFYMSVEPYVRKKEPGILITWTRTLRGNWRDPLVGRHVLLGCLFGMLAHLCYGHLAVLGPLLTGGRPSAPNEVVDQLAVGLAPLESLFITLATVPIEVLAFVLVYAAARSILRSEWVAAPLMIAIAMLPNLNRGLNSFSEIIFVGCAATFFFLSLRLFGMLAAAITLATSYWLNDSVIIPDPNSWAFPASLFWVAVLLAVAFYGFRTSLGGRPAMGRLDLID